MITGFILAGGRGSRMGYQNKGLVLFRQQPMVAWVRQRLQPQVDDLVINANRDQEKYQQIHPRVVSDIEPGFQGPLAGIYTGLSLIEAGSYLMVVPCDNPRIPRDLVTRLYAAIQGKNENIAAVHDGRYRQPAYCLLQQSYLDNLLAFLNAGQNKLGLWLSQNKVHWVDFSDQSDCFVNINSREDLLRYQ